MHAVKQTIIRDSKAAYLEKGFFVINFTDKHVYVGHGPLDYRCAPPYEIACQLGNTTYKNEELAELKASVVREMNETLKTIRDLGDKSCPKSVDGMILIGATKRGHRISKSDAIFNATSGSVLNNRFELKNPYSKELHNINGYPGVDSLGVFLIDPTKQKYLDDGNSFICPSTLLPFSFIENSSAFDNMDTIDVEIEKIIRSVPSRAKELDARIEEERFRIETTFVNSTDFAIGVHHDGVSHVLPPATVEERSLYKIGKSTNSVFRVSHLKGSGPTCTSIYDNITKEAPANINSNDVLSVINAQKTDSHDSIDVKIIQGVEIDRSLLNQGNHYHISHWSATFTLEDVLGSDVITRSPEVVNAVELIAPNNELPVSMYGEVLGKVVRVEAVANENRKCGLYYNLNNEKLFIPYLDLHDNNWFYSKERVDIVKRIKRKVKKEKRKEVEGEKKEVNAQRVRNQEAHDDGRKLNKKGRKNVKAKSKKDKQMAKSSKSSRKRSGSKTVRSLSNVTLAAGAAASVTTVILGGYAIHHASAKMGIVCSGVVGASLPISAPLAIGLGVVSIAIASTIPFAKIGCYLKKKAKRAKKRVKGWLSKAWKKTKSFCKKVRDWFW